MKARSQLAPLLGAIALCFALAAPSAQAAFGIKGFGVSAINEDGAPDTLAGSHPYEYTLGFELNQNAQEEPEGKLSQVIVDLPPGLIGNPQSLPKCTRAQFDFNFTTICPGNTQVGVGEIELNRTGRALTGLYNLTPTPGAPATLGLTIDNNNALFEPSLRSASDYGIRVSDISIPTAHEIQAVSVHVWGLPQAPVHDPGRFCIPADPRRAIIVGCASDAPPAPFLTLPTACNGPLKTTIRVASVQEPGVFREATALSLDENEEPVGLDGCNQLAFEPSIESQPTTNLADSPSGLDFDLHQAQEAPFEPQPGEGEHRPGQEEICQTGTWSGEPSAFAYQWLRNGAPIAGAEAKQYVVTAADEGAALQCEVTATNAAGAGRAVSPAAAVSPAPATPPPVVAVSGAGSPPGIPADECQHGDWSGSPSFAYRWFKDGALVAGQSTATFTAPLSPPYTLQCEIAATNAGGTVLAFAAAVSSPPPSPSLPVIAPSASPPAFEVAQHGLPRATSPAKDVTVTLPAGMSLDPSAANGLAACSEAQVGYLPPGVHFSESPQSCPDAAKVGTVEASSPLLEDPVKGAVYVAAPFANPFGSLLAIYLALEDPKTGIVAKLGGEVEPDPRTGQLKTTFLENPQLPIEDVRLHLFEGPRAALRTPLACGAHTTTSTMTPWSAPEGADAHPSDTFTTSVAAGDSGPCPASEAQAPNKPSFSAGNLSPQAGAYSPFSLELSRPDGSQQLTGIDTVLPPGLTGKLAGIATCSDAQLAVAKSREAPNRGALEQQSPSCPASSEVGTVTVGAGAGVSPFYATGHAYLAGPYKAAPISLVAITPAVAGPFDLGDVVVRAALNVDPETARIHAVSDPIPSILDGIPLDIRSIALNLGRPQFTLNPTSCNPMSIVGSAATLPGQSAALSSPFQVGGCNALPFKPTLATRLTGPTKRGRFPALRATLSAKPGEANSARVAVTLPHSEFLEQGHFGTICTRVQFAAKACPEKSVYGSVRVITPLLDYPLEGPVYLRSSNHNLPDLVLALRGPANQPIEVTLDGRIDSVNRGIRTTFEGVPDAPFATATLTMPGGKKGLLVNSTNVCESKNLVNAVFSGQNGKEATLKPVLRNPKCAKATKKRHGKAARRRGR